MPAGEAWMDASIVGLLEKRLGDSYQLYQEYIEGMNHVIDKLCHELALDDELVQSKLSSRNVQQPRRELNLLLVEMTYHSSYSDFSLAMASPFAAGSLQIYKLITTNSTGFSIRVRD
ncbi:hypothetical protein J3E68DRAFT_398122 [Trichoderma sp. SZMC 28012]